MKDSAVDPIYNKFHQRLGGYQFLCVDHELPHDFPMTLVALTATRLHLGAKWARLNVGKTEKSHDGDDSPKQTDKTIQNSEKIECTTRKYIYIYIDSYPAAIER